MDTNWTCFSWCKSPLIHAGPTTSSPFHSELRPFHLAPSLPHPCIGHTCSGGPLSPCWCQWESSGPPPSPAGLVLLQSALWCFAAVWAVEWHRPLTGLVWNLKKAEYGAICPRKGISSPWLIKEEGRPEDSGAMDYSANSLIFPRI